MDFASTRGAKDRTRLPLDWAARQPTTQVISHHRPHSPQISLRHRRADSCSVLVMFDLLVDLFQNLLQRSQRCFEKDWHAVRRLLRKRCAAAFWQSVAEAFHHPAHVVHDLRPRRYQQVARLRHREIRLHLVVAMLDRREQILAGSSQPHQQFRVPPVRWCCLR